MDTRTRPEGATLRIPPLLVHVRSREKREQLRQIKR
jgi:hypothetical protein